MTTPTHPARMETNNGKSNNGNTNSDTFFTNPTPQRHHYLDHLKILLVFLVILHHASWPYGSTDFWEYQSSLGEFAPVLGRFIDVNSAFFMSFFFLIAGYFIPMSFDRNNGAGFVRKRLIKYGIPVLLVFILARPLQVYYSYANYSGNQPLSFVQYYSDIWLGINGMPEGFISTFGFPEMHYGHTWFVMHLLVYGIIYWVVRKAFTRLRSAGDLKLRDLKLRDLKLRDLKRGDLKLAQESKPFTAVHLLGIALLLTAAAAAIGIWYPVGYWTVMFLLFQVEVAHWPQHIILFVFGIIAYRKNWLAALPRRTGYIVLLGGLVMAALVYLDSPVREFWSAYESFMAVGLIFGLITLFREHANETSPFLAALSRSAYAAYLIHYPIVLVLQIWLDKASLGGALGKFAAVSVLSVIITFGLSCLLTKVRFLRKILL